MQIAQLVLRDATNITDKLAPLTRLQPDLLLAFGASHLLSAVAAPLAATFPAARRIGCSTAGEISAAGVSDESCVLTAIRFASTQLVQASTRLSGMNDSLAAGRRLATQLPPEGLRAVLVFAQGVSINGSALLLGIGEVLRSELPVAGGLAGDGNAFRETWVLDDGGIRRDGVVALGFYGPPPARSERPRGALRPRLLRRLVAVRAGAQGDAQRG